MDKASFERLYLAMLPGLYRIAQSILRSEADAQDTVQQADGKKRTARCLKLLKSRPSKRRRNNPKNASAPAGCG